MAVSYTDRRGEGMLNGLDLFSGIGGISKALEQWVRTIAYCEIDPYCQGVLLSRMESGDIDKAPICTDIKSLQLPSPLNNCVDIIFGGFPCQGVSVAGLGKGLADERSGLFYEIVRLCREIKPRFIFLENVPAITTRGGTEVVREIAALGYDCRWCVISAASVGALHRRERWFLLAHAKHHGTSAGERGGSPGECSTSGQEQGQPEEGIGKVERTGGLSSDVANTVRQGLEGFGRRAGSSSEEESLPSSSCEDQNGNTDSQPSNKTDTCTGSIGSSGEAWRDDAAECWPFESREHWQEVVSTMGKCSDGISHHVDRLRALGNSVVPVQVKEAFEILMGIKDGKN